MYKQKNKTNSRLTLCIACIVMAMFCGLFMATIQKPEDIELSSTVAMQQEIVNDEQVLETTEVVAQNYANFIVPEEEAPVLIDTQTTQTSQGVLTAYAFYTDDGNYYNDVYGGVISLNDGSSTNIISVAVDVASTHTLKATNTTGYAFVGWYNSYEIENTENLLSTEAEITTFPMSEDGLTYFAIFSKLYSIQVTPNDEDAVEIKGEGSYYYGQKVLLIADISNEYDFENWTLTSGILPESFNVNDCSNYFVMPANNLILKANVKKIELESNPYEFGDVNLTFTFQIVVLMNGATLSSGDGVKLFVEYNNDWKHLYYTRTYKTTTTEEFKTDWSGTVWFTITAYYGSGYTLNTISGFSTGVEASYSKGKTFQLWVNAKSYSLSYNSGNYTFSPYSLSTTVYYKQYLTIGVKANSGYELKYFTVNGTTYYSQTGIYVTGNVNINVVTDYVTRGLSLSKTGNGTITAGSTSLKCNQTTTVYFYPNDGSIVKSISATGGSLSGYSSNSRTFTMGFGTGNATVSVVFERQTYTVRFSLSGASGVSAPSSMSCNFGQSYYFPSIPSAYGYQSNGYWEGSGVSYGYPGYTFSNNSFNYVSNGGTVTLTARYSLIRFTINYMVGDASYSSSSQIQQSATFNTTLYSGAQCGFSKAGYSFQGWSKTQNSTTVSYKSGASAKDVYDGSISYSLYPVWKGNTYYISYNGNSASGGSTPNSTHIYGEYKNLTKNGYYKNNYDFDGWTYGGNTYADEASVINLTTSATTITFYAKWKARTYTVTANAWSINNGSNYANNQDGGTVQVKYNDINNKIQYAGVGETSSTDQAIQTFNITLLAEPKTGYAFVGWYEMTTNKTSFTQSEFDSMSIKSTSNSYSTQNAGQANMYYHARYVKIYTLKVYYTTNGITQVSASASAKSTTKGPENAATAKYYYGQRLATGAISATFDANGYYFNGDGISGWKYDTGSKTWPLASFTLNNISQPINDSTLIRMPDGDVTLQAITVVKQYNLKVYAMFTTDGSTLRKGSTGGSVAIGNYTIKEITTSAFTTNNPEGQTKSIDFGTKADLKATAPENFYFWGWKKNPTDITVGSIPFDKTSITQNPTQNTITTDTMTKDGLYYFAVFVQKYTLNINYNVSQIDRVDKTPNYVNKLYYIGEKISLSAVEKIDVGETNTGYAFTEWTATAGDFSNATNKQSDFTMPNQNTTITANSQVREFTLTIKAWCGENSTIRNTSEGGTVSFSYNGHTYNAENEGGTYYASFDIVYHTTARLNANATIGLSGSEKDRLLAGYTFMGWVEKKGDDTNPSYNGPFISNDKIFTIDPIGATNATYHAIFLKNYQLTITKSDGIDSIIVGSDSSTTHSYADGYVGVHYFGESLYIDAEFNKNRFRKFNWYALSTDPIVNLDRGVKENTSPHNCTITIGKGNSEIEARVDAKPFALYADEYYQNNIKNGYILGEDGGKINTAGNDTEWDGIGIKGTMYGTSLCDASILTVNTGFTFDHYDRYMYDEDTNTWNWVNFGGREDNPKMPNPQIVPKNKLSTGDPNYDASSTAEAEAMIYFRAYFTRNTYAITIANYYTSNTDNETEIMGTNGGSIVAPSTYNYNVPFVVTATPNTGFKVRGFYKNNTFLNLWNYTNTVSPFNFNASLAPTQENQTGDIKIVVVFERIEYSVALNSGVGVSLSVNDVYDTFTAFYGQVFNNVNYEYNSYAYYNINVNIYKGVGTDKDTSRPSGVAFGYGTYTNGDNLGGEKYIEGEYEKGSCTNGSFTMPAFDISIDATVYAYRFQLTYLLNTTDTSAKFDDKVVVISESFATGNVLFETNDYIVVTSDGSDIKVPNPTRNGFTFVGWSFEQLSDVYNVDNTKYYLTKDNCMLTASTWLYAIDKTLYAIWKIEDPEVVLNYYDGVTTLQYDGQYHNILKAEINNALNDYTYTYTFYDNNNNLITTSEGNVLKVKNAGNKSYYCVVEIVGFEKNNVAPEEDTTISARNTDNVDFEITKAPINVKLANGSVTIVGDTTKDLASEDVIGLLGLHRFKSGSVTFRELPHNVITYSNTSNKNEIVIDLNIVLRTNTNIDEEDGVKIVDNYDITYLGSVTVNSVFNFAQVNAGIYERQIKADFSDDLSRTAMQNVRFTIRHEDPFVSWDSNKDGVYTNYLNTASITSNKSFTISVNNSTLPSAKYGFYKLYINDSAVDPSLYSFAENGDLIITPNPSMYLTINEIETISFKLYYTQYCLVTFDHGFVENEVEDGYATYAIPERFIIQNQQYINLPDTDPTRVGFTFDGWYFDTSYSNTKKVNDNVLWTKTGNINLYAKWNVNPIQTSDIKLKVDDVVITNNPAPKTYDGVSYTLSYVNSNYNPALTYVVTWFKNNGTIGSPAWDSVFVGESYEGIKDCSQSGMYSLTIVARYSISTHTYTQTFTKTIDKSVVFTINKKDLTSTIQNAGINKDYDGTTSLNDVILNGVSIGENTEKIKLSATFTTSNVNYRVSDKQVLPVDLNNIQLTGVDSTNIDNYTFDDGIVYTGIINQANLLIVYNDSETFVEGTPYEKTKTQATNTANQSINYTVKTSSSEVGIYTPTDDVKVLLFVVNSIKDADGTSILQTNYNIQYTGSSVELTKAPITGVKFESAIITYDGQGHRIDIKNATTNVSVDEDDFGTGVLKDVDGYKIYDQDDVDSIIKANYSFEGSRVEQDGDDNWLTNAGSRNVVLVLYGDENHSDLTLYATLTITKAKIEYKFKYNDEDLKDRYSYLEAGYDKNKFTVNTVNIVNPTCIPTNSDIQIDVLQNNISVSTVKNLGLYIVKATLTGETNINNYEIIGDIQKSFEITKKMIGPSDIGDIIDDPITPNYGTPLVYSGIDKKTDLIATFTSKLAEGLRIKSGGVTCYRVKFIDGRYSYSEVSSMTNVGEYKISIKIEATNPDLYVLQATDSLITNWLKIIPFEISSSNSVVNADKEYDGTKSLVDDAYLTINLGGISESLNFFGDFNSANVGNNISIVDYNVSNKDSYLATNYTLGALFNPTANISKSNATIAIFENGVGDTSFINVDASVTTQFVVNKNVNIKYVDGMQNGEYIVATFETNQNVIDNDYPYSTNTSLSYYTSLVGNIIVYNKDGEVITNGNSNYNFTIDGGIRLTRNITSITFVTSTITEYDALNKPVEITLTQYDSEHSTTITESFEYDFTEHCFIDKSDNSLVPQLLLCTYNGTGDISSISNYTPVNELIHAGSYELYVIDTSSTCAFSSNGSISSKQVFTITPYKYTLNVETISREYGSFVEIDNVEITTAKNDIFIVSVKQIDETPYFDAGTYQISLDNFEFKSGYPQQKIGSQGLVSDYVFTLGGILNITPKTISVMQDYSLLNIVYSASELIGSINPNITFRDSLNQLVNLVNDRELGDYYIVYTDNGENPLTSIINSGNYKAFLYSTNYSFVDGSQTASRINYIDFDFTVSPKILTADWQITPNLIYNAQQRTPANLINITGFEGSDTFEMLGLEICYYAESSDIEHSVATIKNAGTYFADVTITNNNYTFGTIAEEFDINRFDVSVVFDSLHKPSFYKTYNTSDPDLDYEYLVSETNEYLTVRYTRESGEEVGKYALLTASISPNGDILIVGNYTINNNAVRDSAKSFEIRGLTGDAGIIKIILKNNIEKIYDGVNLATLNLNDPLLENCYEIQDNTGKVLSNTDADTTNNYNLLAIFDFGGFIAKDYKEGGYSLTLSDMSTSLSHIGGIVLNAGEYKFIINKKEISINEDASAVTITKQYDANSIISVHEILTTDDICLGDNIEITGTLENSSNIPMVNVGSDYVVSLVLNGADKGNYYIKASDLKRFTGDITEREVTITDLENNNISTINKEYDKTEFILTSGEFAKIKLGNLVVGEYPTFTAWYKAGENVAKWAIDPFDEKVYDIEFSIADTNYKIVGTYTGRIEQKSLTLSESSVLTKSYDGNTTLDITRLELVGIIPGDDVSILSAAFLTSSVTPEDGETKIDIRLTGEHYFNYSIEAYGKILNQLLNVYFHYGDDSSNEGTDYIYPFRNNLVEMENDTIKTVQMSYSDSLDMEIGNLPEPKREGYNFNGWFTQKTEGYKITNKTKLKDNNDALGNITFKEQEEIHFYAQWIANTYNVQLSVLTENIANDYYMLSLEGGNFKVNNVVYNTNEEETLAFEYYEEVVIEFVKNTHFTLKNVTNSENVAYDVNENIFTIDNIYSDFGFLINYDRERYSITIDTLTRETIRGIETSLWNSNSDNDERTSTIISKQNIKYGVELKLPLISRIGYSFGGYTDELSVEYIPSNIQNQFLTVERNMSFTSNWEAKEFTLTIDYDNGGSENDGTIDVTYGATVGILPSLLKDGFNQKTINGGETAWLLYCGDYIKNYTTATDEIIYITSSYVWDFDGEGGIADNFVLKAQWNENDNTFEVASVLDTSKYDVNGTYETFEGACVMTYSVSEDESSATYSPYPTDGITAKTDRIVKFVFEIVKSDFYTFDGWYVNNVKLTETQQTIGGVEYKTLDITTGSKSSLTITDYKWGEDNPTIEAKYTPKLILVTFSNLKVDLNGNIEESIYEYGSVDIKSGYTFDNGQYKVYAGQNVEFEYVTNDGYEFVEFEISPLNVEITEGDYYSIERTDIANGENIVISNFCVGLNIDFKFRRQTYNMSLNIPDNEAYDSSKYSINDNNSYNDIDEDNEVLVSTGDKVYLLVFVNYGYHVSNSSITPAGINMSLIQTDGNDFYINDLGQKVYNYEISDFTKNFEVNLEFNEDQFTVTAVSYIRQPNTSLANAVIDIENDNSVVIMDSTKTNLITTEVPYLTEIVLIADIFKESVNINEVVYDIEKYQFVGWYIVDANNIYTLIPGNNNSSIESRFMVENSVDIRAVFEIKQFKVEFILDTAQNENPKATLVVDNDSTTTANVIYGGTIENGVEVVANTGYKLSHWEITYNYGDAYEEVVDNTIITNKITDANISNVKANIVCKAILVPYELNIKVQASFSEDGIDATYENSDGDKIDKIYVTTLTNTGSNFDFETKTWQEFQLVASCQKGYEFDHWEVCDGNGNPISIDDAYLYYQSYQGDELNIYNFTFINQGENVNPETNINYVVKAIFARITNYVDVKLTLEKIVSTDTTAMEAGTFEHVGVYDGRIDGSQSTSGDLYVLTDDILEFRINLYYGYHIKDSTLSDLIALYAESGITLSYELEDISELPYYKEQYSARYLFTLEGVKGDNISINIALNRNETIVTFKYYEESTPKSFFGKFYYGSSKVELEHEENRPELTPTSPTQDFIGWVTTDAFVFIVNNEGTLSDGNWKRLDVDSLELNRHWETKKVKLDIVVYPDKATMEEDYFEELLGNFSSLWDPIIIHNEITEKDEYYFQINNKFGISQPNVKANYIFSHFETIKVVDDILQWVRIDETGTTTYSSSEMFYLENYSDYEYPDNLKTGEFQNLTNGTIYIKLVYNIQINIELQNYYNDGRISFAGGNVSINNESNKTYQFEMNYGANILALASDGYEFMYWSISGEDNYRTSQTLTNFRISEPLTLIAVFRGKVVAIKPATDIANGKAYDFVGGHVEGAGVDRKTVYRVGDIITLSALANEGYKFDNVWEHSAGGSFQGTEYIISAEDYALIGGETTDIKLSPVFVEKELTVVVEIDTGAGIISNDTYNFSNLGDKDGVSKYSFKVKYTETITLTITPNNKYFLPNNSIKLIVGTNQTNIMLGEDNKIALNYTSTEYSFANNDIITLKIEFNAKYWDDYVKENLVDENNGIYTLKNGVGFKGSGTSNDPFKISNINDFVLWSFIVNNNVDDGKYNNENSFYIVTAVVDFDGYFWTPVGTKDNPFKGKISIYYDTKNVEYDKNSKDYLEENYDSNVLNQTKGLIGYVTNIENITFTNNFLTVYLIIGGIGLLVLIIILLIVIVNKHRNNQIENFEQKQTSLTSYQPEPKDEEDD